MLSMYLESVFFSPKSLTHRYSRQYLVQDVVLLTSIPALELMLRILAHRTTNSPVGTRLRYPDLFHILEKKTFLVFLFKVLE